MIFAVVGAGGKTTLSNFIGQRLADTGRRVLFTTTTKIALPEGHLYLGPPEGIHPFDGFMTAAKAQLDTGKLEGYGPGDITIIAASGLFDDIIVEADGAARKPVKAPNETEPVYPASVDLAIGVIGLDCIEQPMDDAHVHRPELFSRVTQAAYGERITPQHIVRLIGHPEGLFRHAPTAPRVVFLNKYDTIDKETRIQAKDIMQQSPYPVMLTGYDTDWFQTFFQQFLQGDNHAH